MFAKYEKRWCVLMAGEFNYYMDRADYLEALGRERKGGFPLRGASVSGNAERLTVHVPVSNYFHDEYYYYYYYIYLFMRCIVYRLYHHTI